VAFALDTLFGRGRHGKSAVYTAVVTDPWAAIVIHHRDVVGVMNNGGIHVGDGGVVGKVPAVPAATVIARAVITTAVVDAAVEADMRPPVTAMKHIEATGVPPIGGGP
jgi:hypothetical protein